MQKIIILFFCCFLVGCQAENSTVDTVPQATNGSLDLSTWDFEKDGKIWLNGEWEFYWQELKSPNDFLLEKNETPDFINLPQAWNKKLDELGKPLPAEGFATFRLKIKLPPAQEKLALRITEVRDAYRLFVNQELVAEHGKVGEDAASTIPRGDFKMMTFKTGNGVTEIVLQVANFRSSKAGLFRKSLLLGTEQEIQRVTNRKVGIILFLFGCFLIIGFSHLLFYYFRRRNRAALYFSVLCLLSLIRVLTTGDKLLIYWFDVSTAQSSKLAYLSIYLLIPFFFKYLNALFPKDLSARSTQVIATFGFALALFIFIAPNSWSPKSSLPFQILVFGATLYLMYGFFKVLKNRRPGGIIFTIGILIVIFMAWNDTVYERSGSVERFLFPFGILIFMLLQAFFLVQLFATNIDDMRKLSDTFKKFVPLQFLRRIDQHATNDIPVGVAKELLLSISFLDIRSFSNISEQMSSHELLIFLNGFFENMNQPINKNFGFIDKYIGDSIMSIFDRKEADEHFHPEDSVRAAVEMHLVQQAYEKQNPSATPIQFGVGIHTGKVILGTLGSDKRMDSTVIGDSVNLAARLESLTKYYDAQIIISEATHRNLNLENFHLRQLDKVVVKGKSNIVAIYEVFDANDLELKKMKVESMPAYELGLDFYYARRWGEALECFRESLEIFSGDVVARRYVERCVFYEKNPPAERWEGEYVYDVK